MQNAHGFQLQVHNVFRQRHDAEAGTCFTIVELHVYRRYITRHVDGDPTAVLLHAMQRLHIILSADSPRAAGFGSRRVHCGRKRLRAQLHGPGIDSALL